MSIEEREIEINNDSVQQEDMTPSLGKLLKQARIDKKLSVKEVARKLKLTSLIIENIEQDNWEFKEAAIYVKGYINNYLNLLGINVDQTKIDNVVDQCRTPELVYEESSHNYLWLNKYYRKAKYLVATLFVMITLSMLVRQPFKFGEDSNNGENLLTPQPASLIGDNPLTITNQTGSDTQTNLSGSDNASNQSRSNIDLQPQQTMNGVDLTNNAAGSLIDDGIEASTSTSESILDNEENVLSTMTEAESDSNLAVDDAPGEKLAMIVQNPTESVYDDAMAQNTNDLTRSTVTLELLEDCWVEIDHVNGDRIEYDLLRANTTKQYEFTDEVRIFFANAAGVKVLLNGSQIDFDPFTAKNYAKFALSQQGFVDLESF